MSRRRAHAGVLLDLWRPPEGAGEPIGCLTTTYTFSPALFDEHCLPRFLEIDSEPDREDLAFLLERENRLGGVYAGVLVDVSQAGVEHSLRWDVLPVRIRGAKQHAKLSLLAWAQHVRIIVASANLTEPGYRTNHEVAAPIDLSPRSADHDLLSDAVGFLRKLLVRVPGSGRGLPEVERARQFLDSVGLRVGRWVPRPRTPSVRQRWVFTLPESDGNPDGISAIDECLEACRRRDVAPHDVWVASPFFDPDETTSRVTATLCRRMARGRRRHLRFAVPGCPGDESGERPRLLAPRALIRTAASHDIDATVELLPRHDAAKNLRVWHAKMLTLQADNYVAMMIGSSNFTCAGMGVGHLRNAEANLLTILDKVPHAKEPGRLLAVWPETEPVAEPDSADWLGSEPDQVEEEQAPAARLPAGFLAATFHAGDPRHIALLLDPSGLPASWLVLATGRDPAELLTSARWADQGGPDEVELAWVPVQPPEKLAVRWDGQEAFLPLNVTDSRALPPPAHLEQMSADDMLGILAASDPSAAMRAWARRQEPVEGFDEEYDSATPVDLDPLRRYDLRATFLQRVQSRARILAQLRASLQRPVWNCQGLQWRLRGMVGVEALAERYAREFLQANGNSGEALLNLADFLIVLREVDYRPIDGALSRERFQQEFQPFLHQLGARLGDLVRQRDGDVSTALLRFWDRVMERLQQ